MGGKHEAVEAVEALLRSSGIDVSKGSPGRARRTGRARSLVARVRRWLLLRIAHLALCVCLAAVMVGSWSTGGAGDPIFPPTAPPGALRVGTVDPRFGVVQAYDAPAQAALLPIGWERMPFWWKELQKTGPDSWDPFATDHDRIIDQELSHGRTIVGLLINTPDWAAADPALHGASPPKGLYQPYDSAQNYWGHFVGLIAKRYAGRIDDWIIWNEVNIPSGHWKTWGGTAADYAQLLKVAYRAAKAANPRARIVLAGDPYWYDHGAFFSGLLATLARDPAARSNHDFFDAANLHLYSRPSDIVTVVSWYRSAMARAGIDKPIWISEMNAIPYDDTVRTYPRGNYRTTVDDQASYILQAFALALAEGVQRIEVNRMVDGTDFKAGGEPFGLVRNDGSARPAFYAYRTAAVLFAGATGGMAGYDALDGVYTVTLHSPGARVTIVWDQHPAAVAIALSAPAGAEAFDKFGQRLPLVVRGGITRVDLTGSTGNTNSANPKDYVIGGNPVVVVMPG